MRILAAKSAQGKFQIPDDAWVGRSKFAVLFPLLENSFFGGLAGLRDIPYNNKIVSGVAQVIKNTTN